MPEGQGPLGQEGQGSLRQEAAEETPQDKEGAPPQEEIRQRQEGRPQMKRAPRILGLALCALLAAAILAVPAQAAFGINGFNITFEEEGGAVATRAGSHPFVNETTFHVNFHEDAPNEFSPDEELKNFEVALPIGFAGNPTATPRCSHLDFATREIILHGSASCPPDTAVGVAFPEANHPGPAPPAPIFNLDPPPGVAAELGFYASNIVPVVLDLTVSQQKPYRVVASSINIPQPVKVYGAVLDIWGNPESSIHDEERGNCVLEPNQFCPNEGAPEKPFLTLPRACATALTSSYAAVSWQNPLAAPITGLSESSLTPSECETLAFDLEVPEAKPTSQAAETPSGLNFELKVDDPGLSEVTGTADADIKKAVVTLPEGFTTNSSVANGLQGCTQAAFESETLESTLGTGCPEASKVGSVEVESPLLEKEASEGGGLRVLPGSIYVAKQGDNEFGNLLTIDMVIKEPKLGILIRAAGRVDPNPTTGQLTTTFDNFPQLPFSSFRLHFREGERAPLLTPPTCGTFTTNANLYSYALPDVALPQSASFVVNSGADGTPCASNAAQLPNAPGFNAGTTDPTAGAYAPFVLNLSRADGSQQISRIDTTLPEGLLGKLAGIPYCPEAAIAQANARSAEGEGASEVSSPSCPSSSEVGTVTVSAGAGSQPLFVGGKAYLAGPYKGAPLSLEILTPAIAGPFDLGVVAVRTALQVDPLTAMITAESDPIPTILHGLPLDVRSISININRPSFTLNPTSCEPKSIIGTATSTLGSVAALSQYFQATDCGALEFKPKLQLSLKGQTKRAGHPALRAVLTYPKGGAYANIARAQVSLPHSEFLDQGNLNKVCTQPELKAAACPARSIYGKVKAWTPLLEKPLEGNVYLGVGFGYKLPALVAELNGQIRVLLVGKVDTDKQNGIRNTFEAVPDAPVERFVLELKGGKKYGLLENSENLCRKAQRATVAFRAQNGKAKNFSVKIANSCGKKKRKPKKHG
jgi:hypothetical protein